MKKNTWSFLTIGQTQQSSNVEFKRYIGLGTSYPIALNPTKAQLEEIFGRELNYEPEYYGVDEETGTKWARLDFIMKLDPEKYGDTNTITHATFTIRNEKYVNKDNTKVRVIDKFGNSVWATNEEANDHKKLFNPNGSEQKIADYRIARKGEPELCDFLRKLINTPDAFDYNNGVWALKNLKNAADLTKEEAMDDKVLTYESCMISFDKNDFENIFKGDVSFLWEFIKDRIEKENLRVTLMYGISTNNEGKQRQVVCTGYDMMLRKKYNAKALQNLEKNLVNAKSHGLYASTEYRICELQEWTVEPTNLEAAASTESNSIDWDNLGSSTSVSNDFPEW